MTAFRLTRVARVVVMGLAAACARVTTVGDPSPAVCPAPADSRWRVAAGQAVRDVGVFIDQSAQQVDGWSAYGWRRLRSAMAAWNALRLPVQFVDAPNAREAGVVVNVVEVLPRGAEGRDGDQAGITTLAIAGGGIIRASVFIASATPYGTRFTVAAQQANLLHELGHALGLPHTAVNSAIMSAHRTGSTLTGADITLARTHYGACARR